MISWNEKDELGYEATKGFILERFGWIEELIDGIIGEYLSIKDKNTKEGRYFYQILLNSSIISFGSKIKLLKYIASDKNILIKRDQIHRLVSLRNVFAHCTLQQSIKASIDSKNPKFDENGIQLMDIKITHDFLVMNNDGTVEYKEIDVIRDEFYKLYEEVKEMISLIK